MKHFALVGLLVALGMARLNAAEQPPNLFTVEIDPTAGTAKISASLGVISQGLFITETLTPNDGITLINFFPNSFGIPTSQTNSGVSLVSLNAVGSLRAFPVTYPQNPGEALIYGPPATFDRAVILEAGSLGQRDTQSPLNSYPNPTNPGLSLNFFALDNYSFDLLDLAFAAQDSSSPPSLTISFPFSLPVSQSDYDLGPKYVYAGFNSVFSQTFDGVTISSFLGTYTISVVPEPSTYAAIAGGLGLAAAVIHRRRQRAKAAQA
jgi:hypothetical protein